jgi:hypothetical protein
MPRTNYALATDVIRRFDPTLTQATINSDDFVGYEDVDTIQSRIGGVESTFESRTDTALREVRAGSVGAPGTYEYLDAKRTWNFPTSYWLENTDVLPFDASQGDKIEVRTARDNWRDITNDDGSRYVLVDPRQGKLEFYSRLRHTIQFRVRPGVRFLRLTYRYGALGGDRTSGGETTLSEQLTGDTTTTVDVADASRLPAGEYTMLVGGSEYVGARVADASANTVEITDRGRRRTDRHQDHASGATLHYCPMVVREAVAAKTARELIIYDDYTDWMVEGSNAFDKQGKLDEWEQEWERAVARFDESGGYA